MLIGINQAISLKPGDRKLAGLGMPVWYRIDKGEMMKLKTMTNEQRQSVMETINYIARGNVTEVSGEIEQIRYLSDRHVDATKGLLMVLFDKGIIDESDLELMY